MKRWFCDSFGWAQPVVRPGWAVIAVVLDWIKRASGYRVAVGAEMRAWHKAIGQ